MSPIDPDRVESLIGAVREAVRMLAEIGGLAEPAFRADPHRQASAKYNFIVAIEACIDLASHLISHKGFRAPEDYADTFRVLAEHAVIEPAFADELGKMARFRNRLVHLYAKVDVGEVWRILQSRLGDFERYIADVARYLA